MVPLLRSLVGLVWRFYKHASPNGLFLAPSTYIQFRRDELARPVALPTASSVRGIIVRGIKPEAFRQRVIPLTLIPLTTMSLALALPPLSVLFENPNGMDSLAPTRSALAGLRLRRIPFAVSPNGSSPALSPAVARNELPWVIVPSKLFSTPTGLCPSCVARLSKPRWGFDFFRVNPG